MPPEQRVDASARNDSFHDQPLASPQRFLVTSRGASATRWLCYALASHSGVFVAHGKHALESIRSGYFDRERSQDDTASLVLGNVMSDFYRCRPLTEVFDIYGHLQPGTQALGNVHTYYLDEVYSRFDPAADLSGIRIVNVIRHPVMYIASHTAMARSAHRYPALRQPLRSGFERALEQHPELLRLEHNDPVSFEAFVVSCYSAAQWVADLRIRTVLHVKMEEVTSNVDCLVWLCEYMTRLSYDRERLAGFIQDGPINRHRQATSAVTPRDAYGRWETWQRTIAALVLSEELLEQFEVEGYDVAMLRNESQRTVRRAESQVVASGTVASMSEAVPEEQVSPVEPPLLVELGYRAYNLVRFQKRYIALAQSLGVVDLTQVAADWLTTQSTAKKVLIGESLLDVKWQVDQLTVDPVRSLQENLTPESKHWGVGFGQFVGLLQPKPEQSSAPPTPADRGRKAA